MAETFPQLKDLNEEKLEAVVSAAFVKQVETSTTAPRSVTRALRISRGVSRRKLKKIFASVNDRVQPVVCDANIRGDIKGVLNRRNVGMIVGLILPHLGVSPVVAPPLWVIALAVFILRVGLDMYCRGYRKAR